MAAASSRGSLLSPLGAPKRITTWYIVAAILFVVLGVFSILEPAFAGLGVTLLVGWLLLFGAAAHFVGAFMGGGAKQVVFQILIGLAYAFAGVYFVSHPLLGIRTLTLVLAAVIVSVGFVDVISYFRLKHEARSGWLLANGIIGILLGGLIWIHWPSSSVWAIGILMGVTLLTTGMSRLMFGLSAAAS